MPAPFDPDRPLGAALLEPTRIYVKGVLKALATGGIKALAHVTGGGLTENLPRVLPAHLSALIDLHAMAPSPVFRWLAETGRISEREMLRTFNCGTGMIVVASATDAADVLAAFEASGETVTRIGKLVPAQADRVAYSGLLAL